MKNFLKPESNPALPLFIEGVRRSREGVRSKIKKHFGNLKFKIIKSKINKLRWLKADEKNFFRK